MSEIINEDFSEFIDANSQIGINEESFVQNQSNLILLHPQKDKLTDFKLPQIELLPQKLPPPPPPQEQVVEQKKVEEPVAQSKTTWQKINITKRRTAPVSQIIQASTNEKDQSTSQLNVTSKSNNKNIVEKIKERNKSSYQTSAHIENHPDANQQHQIVTFRVQQEMVQGESQATKRFQSETIRKNFERPVEPLPVFDCLFCCQEHFVLQKTNENMLIKKYAINHSENWKYFLPLLDMTLHPELKVLRDYDSPDQEDESPVRTQREIQSLHHNVRTFKHLAESQVQQLKFSFKYDPVAPSWAQRLQPLLQYNVNEKLRSKAQVQKKSEVQQVVKHIKEDKEQSEKKRKLMNFMEFMGQSLDESNFCNLNMRNRRQKRLENISFESEVHNIFDPYYTSEEELDDISSSNLSESDSCAESSNSSGEEEQKIKSGKKNLSESDSLSSIERQEEEEEGFGFSVEDENIEPAAQIQRINSAVALIKKKKLINTDEDEENSEKLTFGCTTPQQEEDYKVTFTNNEDEPSLSPVRGDIKNQTQEITNEISPSQLQAFEASPISCQDMARKQPKYQISQYQQIDQFAMFSDQGQVTSNSALVPLKRIDFYPKQGEFDSEIVLVQQKSYDTDSKIGHILSDMSQPTEQSKDKSSSSSYENEGEDHIDYQDQTNKYLPTQTSLYKQLSVPMQSHSFTVTQIKSNNAKHQKLIVNKLSKNVQMVSKEAIQQIKLSQMQKPKLTSSPTKKSKNLIQKKNSSNQNKQGSVANSQHFVSFDNIQHNKSQKNPSTKGKSSSKQLPNTLEDGFQNVLHQMLSSRIDETLTSQRQGSASISNRVKTQSVIQNSNDFTQMLDYHNFQPQTVKQSSISVARSQMSKTPVNQIEKSCIQGQKNSILIQGSTPSLRNNEQSNGKFNSKNQGGLSQKEIDNLRNTLCSSRYQTSVQGKSAMFEDKSKHSKGVKVKKTKVNKSNKASACNTIECDRKMKPKINKNHSNLRSLSKASKTSNLRQQFHYLVENNNEKPSVLSYQSSTQHTNRANMYLSMQDGVATFQPNETIALKSNKQNPKLNVHLNNSQSIASKKMINQKKSSKLNGSIEDSQHFLNSIELSQTNGRQSFSLLRQVPGPSLRQDNGSLGRQYKIVPDQTLKFQSTQGQFGISQPQLMNNNPTSLSKSNSNKDNLVAKKKKSKVLSNNFMDPLGSTRQVQTKKKTSSRTRSQSKGSINPTSSHQLLLTQQLMNGDSKMVLKNNQILMSKQVKQQIVQKCGAESKMKRNEKKHVVLSDNSITTDNKSQNRMGSTKELKLSESTGKIYNNSTKLVLSSVTSPLKAINFGNLSNGTYNLHQPQPPQTSISVKESLEFKRSLANDVLTSYLNFNNMQGKKKSKKNSHGQL